MTLVEQGKQHATVHCIVYKRLHMGTTTGNGTQIPTEQGLHVKQGYTLKCKHDTCTPEGWSKCKTGQWHGVLANVEK